MLIFAVFVVFHFRSWSGVCVRHLSVFNCFVVALGLHSLCLSHVLHWCRGAWCVVRCRCRCRHGVGEVSGLCFGFALGGVLIFISTLCVRVGSDFAHHMGDGLGDGVGDGAGRRELCC